MYDVIVVGGGPVGSHVAYKLAGMGHRVVVLERKKRIGEKVCCTGIIGMECVSSFDIESDVVLRRVNSAKLFSPSGNLLRLRREEPQACILDRAALDQAMANRAQRQGAEYMLNSPVRDVKVEADRVKVELFPQNKGINIEARVLVIATGFGSRLAEKLGLGDFGDFVIGAQVEVMMTEVDEVEVYFGRQTAPGFFGWLVPTAPKMAKVGLLSRRNPEIHLGKLLKSLLAQGKIVSTEAELSCGGIPLKPLGKTFGERFVVVGDAAGQVKPTSGGGIYYGLLCAEIAADTLHQALQGDDLSVKSLGKYERDWRRKLGWELKIGYWARKLFERLSDRQLDRIFGIMKDNGIDEALLKAKDLSFDWHGKAILALLGHAVIGKTIGVFKLPSKAAKDI